MDLDDLVAHREAVHEVYVRHMHFHGPCESEFDGPGCECRAEADASMAELWEGFKEKYRPLMEALDRLWLLRREALGKCLTPQQLTSTVPADSRPA